MRGCGCVVALAVVLLVLAGGGVAATDAPPAEGPDGGGAGAPAAAMMQPVSGAVISQPYGCTDVDLEPLEALCPGGHFHSGVDLAAPWGTPVVAALGGRVRVIPAITGYGLHIVVDHGDGTSTLYGHLSDAAVASEEAVASGERIGAVGSTGNSTGPHLHFEVRHRGVPSDPALEVRLP